MDALSLQSAALARITSGDLPAAEKLLRKGLRLAPRDREIRRLLVDTLRMRARARQSEGRRDQARDLYRRALALAPGDARALLGLGELELVSGRAAAGRALLARALRAGAKTLPPIERFKALMKLGRFTQGVAVAEKILDGEPGLDDIRVFWDPWEWDERQARAERLAVRARLEKGLGPGPSPWLHYYRGDLAGGDAGLPEFARLADYPAKRYGWMFFKAATSALLGGAYEQAKDWFLIALASRPVDWRARAFLAETYLCLGLPQRAYAEMDRALAAASPAEAGQARAWRGAFDLWLGRYEDALVHLERAEREGAQCAPCWKAGAWLKLGRAKEALAALDETLARYPLDLEAYVWRGEAKRALGQYKGALADLEAIKLPDSSRSSPLSLWALVNRALVKAALGDRAGLNEDFDAIPSRVLDYVRAKTGLTDREKLLRAALELSRGFRREDYGQAIWMR